MATTHELIVRKMEELPENIKELASEALLLSEEKDATSTSEALKSVIRRIIPNREDS